MNTENALYAGQISHAISIQGQCVVPESAQGVHAVKVTAIRKLPPEPVYNMEVDEYHNFAVNGGLIVHNCMDATRYFVKTMRIATPKSVYISPFAV